jgi:hypothetical protein
MNASAWPLVEFGTRLLDPEEREVVLGDLAETDETAWRGLQDVFGLVLRRQVVLWRDRRPWVAGFAVAFPSSYLLMTASFSVTCTYQRLVNHKVFVGHWPTGHEGFPLLLCHVLLLIACHGQQATWWVRFRDGPCGRALFWLLFPLCSCACLVSGCAFFCSCRRRS